MSSSRSGDPWPGSMTHSDKARKLAEKIIEEQNRAAEAALRYVLKHKTADPALVDKSGVLTATIPYATALLEAQEALQDCHKAFLALPDGWAEALPANVTPTLLAIKELL